MKKTKTRLLVIIAVLAIIVAGAAFTVPFFFSGADKGKTIYIYPEMTEAAFSDSLKADFGQAYARRVMMLSNYRRIVTPRHIGAYRVEKGMSPFDLWRKLSSGAQSPVKFTFNNLRTVADFAESASRQLCMDKNDMLRLLTDSASCASFGFTPQTVPAMLIPDTYEVYWSVKPEKLLEKMHDNYTRFWNDGRKAKAKELGLTPNEVATLASIVEEETAYSPEKGKVARLYLNRLHKGMKLQSDPTVKFAIGDFSLKRILHKHLTANSPYNTYAVEGLPPGPIRLPEKSTVNAVLNAPQHDYIYMCAKADFSGSHEFTASYAEHLRYARLYQAALNRRGIK